MASAKRDPRRPARYVFIESMESHSGSSKVSVVALLVLSLLWAVGMVRSDLLPNFVPDLLPYFERQAIPFALLAILALAITVVRRATWPGGHLFWSSILTFLGLFVAPVGLIYLTANRVPGLTHVALFTLIPVFTLVFEPYFATGASQLRRKGLLAALAGVVGVFCVFPVVFPESWYTGLGFLVIILAAICVAGANCWAVQVAAAMPSQATAPLAAIAGAAAALAFVGAGAVTEHFVWRWDALAPVLLWSAAIELPALLLLFWLLPRMSATRMATRYGIAPLVAIVAGAVLVRPHPDLRTWLGLFLITGGYGYLLLASEEEAEPAGLSLH